MDKTLSKSVIFNILIRYVSQVPGLQYIITDNVCPLRWVHLAEEALSFKEESALVWNLQGHPKLAFEPGQKFAHSNISYWPLSKITERVICQSYPDFLKAKVFKSLRFVIQEMDFTNPDLTQHAKCYLATNFLINLMKRYLLDHRF